MRKLYIILAVAFVIYSVLIGTYLLAAPSSLPAESVGGPADPATFMTEDQIEKSTAYSRIRNVIYFVGGPLEWGIYLLILGLGFSSSFRNTAHSLSKVSLWRIAIFLTLLTLTTSLLQFPLDYYVFKLRHAYDISSQPFADWMGDKFKSFGLSLLMMTPIVSLLYYVMKRNRLRWWLWFWVASIPITWFLMFIQPVVIDPLFHEFTPLKDQKLKQAILALAEQADVPADQVYEVDMSRKTHSLNAYVNGIGPTTRIVLWDTTLNKMKEDEILFIMAHEMGHYVLNHMNWLFLGTIGMNLAALFSIHALLGWMIRRYGFHWGVKDMTDLASLPIILLLVSVLSFLSMPIQNAVSRAYEHAADKYAMQMMDDTDAATRAFQRLAVESLSEVNPPKLVKYMLYGHPTLYERINYVHHYAN